MKNKQVLFFASTLLLVLALVFWFIQPAIVGTGLLENLEISFVDATFGKTDSWGPISLTSLKFSILNLIPFLLLIFALGLSLLKAFGIKLLASTGFEDMLIIVFALVAGVGLLLAPQLTTMTNEALENINLNLGLGAILAGSLTLVSALLAVVSKFLK